MLFIDRGYLFRRMGTTQRGFVNVQASVFSQSRRLLPQHRDRACNALLSQSVKPKHQLHERTLMLNPLRRDTRMRVRLATNILGARNSLMRHPRTKFDTHRHTSSGQIHYERKRRRIGFGIKNTFCTGFHDSGQITSGRIKPNALYDLAVAITKTLGVKIRHITNHNPRTRKIRQICGSKRCRQRVKLHRHSR